MLAVKGRYKTSFKITDRGKCLWDREMGVGTGVGVGGVIMWRGR